MIIFDVETGPLSRDEIAGILPPFDPDSVKIGNRKDPEKIREYIAEQAASYVDDTVDSAPLDACFGRILAVGFYDVDKGKIDAAASSDELTIIAHILDRFADAATEKRKLVGHNILEFDLPFILRRAWILGIEVPSSILSVGGWQSLRFSELLFFDTYKYWCAGSRNTPSGSLDVVSRAMGLSGKPECRAFIKSAGKELPLNGKNFHLFFHDTAENKSLAVEYLRSDLELTAAVARAMGIR